MLFARLLLSHFEGQEVLDVGGTQNCCDNCSKRSVFMSALYFSSGGCNVVFCLFD